MIGKNDILKKCKMKLIMANSEEQAAEKPRHTIISTCERMRAEKLIKKHIEQNLEEPILFTRSKQKQTKLFQYLFILIMNTNTKLVISLVLKDQFI